MPTPPDIRVPPERAVNPMHAGDDVSVAAVCAVLVTHEPDLAVLSQALASLALQVPRIVVVDNASAGTGLHALCARHTGLTFVTLPVNHGLAHGLNEGVRCARTLTGIRAVLLLDQDSVPAPGMVAALCAALARRSREQRVAAVGPCHRDPRDGAAAPFIRIGFPWNRKLRCGDHGDDVRCDFLISSGCLIPLAVLDDVGGMDAAFFIDNVDLDWCFRATARGYALYGVCAARLQHHLGEQRLRLPGLARGIVVHPPRRLYYMLRNRLWLYRRRSTPRRWIAQDVPRLLVKFALFALLVAPRRAYLRQMLAGLRDGIRGEGAPPASG